MKPLAQVACGGFRGALGGALGGAALIAIICLLGVTFSWIAGRPVWLPGLFSANPGQLGGIASVDFMPRSLGMLMVISGFAGFGLHAGLPKRALAQPTRR